MNTPRDRYAEYLKTDYWKAVEREVKSRAGYRCQICNSQHDLQAHHRTYEHRGKELDYLGDLTCLCRRCHAVFHGHLPPIPAPPSVAPVVHVHSSKRERREAYNASMANMTNVRPHTEADIDAEMPSGEILTLTQNMIDRCRVNGSFTSATTEALGVATKMTQGWGQRLVGTVMPRAQYRLALKGKYIYATRRFVKVP